jgi:hypothetical protein
VQGNLRRDWERIDREMSWESAREVTRDAWQRLDEQHRLVGDRDRR